ncbi:MAG: acyl-ACP--UDP-N-acetylglucosamine O-acyltransferase [Thermoanaerobaculia bacterium]|nr:MAG: acyl-ACP--UDP-N-acetylglucosamine O-acyltransferase [Thermoanaerobaculia bacterium]MBZ0101497.1 acyl-ACP--UDP-N-acetylglucosamine O-acyltransferase [Thermoanaerobaculia bacterium]
MSGGIHPLAWVDPSAVLADGVTVGPFARIGAEVEIGEGTEVASGAQIQGPTRIGSGNRIHPHACVGTDPQDLKFAGERVCLEIGDRNQIREHVTIHRGTGKGGGLTRIGDDNLFMVYSHVAHDCRVGSRVIFANNATLAGHCEVDDDAIVGAFSALQQYGRIGRHAYIGGYSRLLADALPYVKTVGMRPAVLGVNRIGLQRKGFDADRIADIVRAFRIYLRSGLNSGAALERLSVEMPDNPDVAYLVDYVRSARRGVIRALPGRRGGEESGGDE